MPPRCTPQNKRAATGPSSPGNRRGQRIIRIKQRLEPSPKKRITNRIIGEIFARDSFLLLGHKNPDADCIASLVAFAILLSKFRKDAAILLPDPVIEQLNYLLAICKYNNIMVILDVNVDLKEKYSALVIVDTPNADMLKGTSKNSFLVLFSSLLLFSASPTQKPL
jgi:hypothetical protein